MQMEQYGYHKNEFIGGAPFQLNLGRWQKALYPKILHNEVSSNESLPLGYARHSGTPGSLNFGKLF
jgi:hypothetical protein